MTLHDLGVIWSALCAEDLWTACHGRVAPPALRLQGTARKVAARPRAVSLGRSKKIETVFEME